MTKITKLTEILPGDKITLTVLRVEPKVGGYIGVRIIFGDDTVDWLYLSSLENSEHHPGPRPLKVGDKVFDTNDLSPVMQPVFFIRAIFDEMATVQERETGTYRTFRLDDLVRVP